MYSTRNVFHAKRLTEQCLLSAVWRWNANDNPTVVDSHARYRPCACTPSRQNSKRCQSQKGEHFLAHVRSDIADGLAPKDAHIFRCCAVHVVMVMQFLPSEVLYDGVIVLMLYAAFASVSGLRPLAPRLCAVPFCMQVHMPGRRGPNAGHGFR